MTLSSLTASPRWAYTAETAAHGVIVPVEAANPRLRSTVLRDDGRPAHVALRVPERLQGSLVISSFDTRRANDHGSRETHHLLRASPERPPTGVKSSPVATLPDTIEVQGARAAVSSPPGPFTVPVVNARGSSTSLRWSPR